ncbi:MAG TPA: hypothetical protein VNA69_11095 [Thermoanaerobaculia bacterium]|nr:hypothetical protein [Thermoanaerobaculia bacterium]
MSTIAFVACIERGELERKAVLLCRSIRRFAGRHSDAPIYTFQPREGTAIAPDTASQLADLGVHHNSERLNTAFAHYGIGNKIFASARAEELASEDVLVFLDSDTVIVDEPRMLELRNGIDAAVRPVDFHHSSAEPESDDDPFWHTRFRRVGSSGPGDPMDAYWLKMYELLGVEARPFVETACSRQRIRAYFNSGLIAVRRSAGLFTQWRDDFLGLMTVSHIPRKGPLHYMDQLSLAVTLARVWPRVEILDRRHNYALPARDLSREPLLPVEDEALVHIHYNSLFETVAQWLEPQLTEVVCS